MDYLTFKNKGIKILVSIMFVILSFLAVQSLSITYALDCDSLVTGATNCNPLTTADCDPAPKPSQILCPFLRIINLLVMMVGVVFLVMVVYGSIKLSVALGDPKGFQGARNTWTFAVVGLFVVLLCWFVFFVLNRTFGLGLAWTNPAAIIQFMEDRLQLLLRNFLLVIET